MVRSAAWRSLAITLVLLLALGVRIAAATKWQRDTLASGQLLRLGDSDSYWILAGHLAHGRAYQYGSPDASIFRAPLYPLALAPFTRLSDAANGVWGARLMGCVVGTWAVWLVMCLARRLVQTASSNDADTRFTSRAEIAAGVLAALYPGAIGMSIVILSEAIFCPLMLLALLGWQRAFTLTKTRTACRFTFAAGIASGLAILARPSWLLFMPLLGTAVLIVTRRRRHHFLALAAMAIGCALVMSPWWLRNWTITHRWVPTTLQVGASLYDGLHPGATGASDEDMQFVNQFIEQQRLVDHQLRQATPDEQIDIDQHSTFEFRLNASMQRAALDWASKNISGAIRLGLLKFARTWSFWPAAGQVGSNGLRLMLTISCFGILAAALVAAWRLLMHAERVLADRSSLIWLLVLCWAPALYFTSLHMVFVGSIRYREPAVLVLTALAGCALGLTRWSNERHGSQSFEQGRGSESN